MSQYIRHDDPRVEPAVADEAAKTEQLVQVIARMQERNFSKHRHGFRGTHVKTQGIVKGELTVAPNLPAHLAQGLFAPSSNSQSPQTYPIAIRYANEPSFLQDDRKPGPRGCGMKVFNVNGKGAFLDPVGEETHTQDFTFNNAPLLELTDLPTALDIVSLRERYFDDGDGLRAELEKRKDTDLQLAPTQLPNQNLLSYTMYSQSAFRWGDCVAKYALFPRTELQQKLGQQKITESSDEDQHSEWLSDFFATNSAEYDFRVQLLVSPEEQPVEDCSKAWDEEKYPFETVGHITIPAQDSFAPARRTFWDDRMKLSPWYGLAEHRPLGSANRLRKDLYRASAARRAEINASAYESVKSIDQIP